MSKKQEALTGADIGQTEATVTDKPKKKIISVMFRDTFASPNGLKTVAVGGNVKSLEFVDDYRFVEVKSVNSVPGKPAAVQTRLIPNDGMNVVFVVTHEE